jgi:squalene cyclase
MIKWWSRLNERSIRKSRLGIALMLSLFLLFPLNTFSYKATANTPTAVGRGLAWLESHRNAAGGWGSAASIRDTAAAVQVLSFLRPASASLPPAYAWLLNRPARSHADQARIALLTSRWPRSTALLASLRADQNPAASQPSRPNAPEGGWGAAAGYTSDSLNTALALAALKGAGSTNSLLPAVAYLVAAQNTDGGWGTAKGAGSSIEITAQVLPSLYTFSGAPGAGEAITRAKQYLLARQNPNGSWGQNSVVQSALAYRALGAASMPAAKAAAAVTFLLNSQSADGSWNGRPYDTALALLALGKQQIYLPAITRRN